MIRIVQGRGTAIEHRVIEVPLRRCDLPDKLRKVVPVFVVARPAAFGGKVILVPPLKLGLRGQRDLAGFLAADQITAHGHHGLAALWPKRRGDIGRPCSPIKTGQDRRLDSERIHERDRVNGEHRRLAVPERFT